MEITFVEWIGIAGFVVAILALVVAVLALAPLPQMLWGGPKLTFEYSRSDVPLGTGITCVIRNAPLEGWRGRFVRREAVQGLSVRFDVFETGTDKPIGETIFPTMKQIGKGDLEVVDLAAGAYPAFFTVAVLGAGQAFVESKEPHPIPSGSYYCEIRARGSHCKLVQQKSFIATPDRLYWTT